MTPKTLLLHIGTPKTGSTSIQERLAQAECDGSLKPVRYPLWEGDRNQRRLAMLYYDYDELPRWSSRDDLPAGGLNFERMREEYRRFLFEELQVASNAVVSYEGSCMFSAAAVRQLRHDVEAVGFREFHVVLYVRDPADFYLSRTQQRLREVGAPGVVTNPETYRYPFLQAAETWEQVFPGRLIVQRYSSAPEDDVTSNFASLLEKHTGVSLPRILMRINKTVSAEAMQILQDYRHVQTSDTASLVRFLKLSAQDVPQTKPILKSHVAGLIRANHRSDADALFTRYGVDLGLRNQNPAAKPPGYREYRVADIVESVNPRIVDELLEMQPMRLHL